MGRPYDPNATDQREPRLIGWLAAFADKTVKRYHRGEVRGIERYPSCPALVAGNHNGGLYSPDTWIALAALYRAGGIDAVPYGLGHDIVMRNPLSGPVLARLGGIAARPDNADRLFAEGRKILVYPGGDFDAMRPPRFSDLKLSLEFDTWRSPARHKFLIVGDKQALSVYPIAEGEVGKALPLKQGEPLQLAATSFAVMVTKVLDRAEAASKVVAYRPAAGQTDAFHDPSEPAIKLRVRTPSGEQSRWLLANTQHGFMEIAGGPTFAYVDNTAKKPIAWVAKLGFYEEGEKVATKIVKVNHPGTYRGFMFYQEDADPKRPKYAGIRVVRDPGWPIVRIGLTMVILGIVFMFYVKPFVRSRKPDAGTRSDDD